MLIHCKAHYYKNSNIESFIYQERYKIIHKITVQCLKKTKIQKMQYLSNEKIYRKNSHGFELQGPK